MSNPCATYAEQQVDNLVGTFDSTPKQVGYPTKEDYNNARTFAMKRICLEQGLEWTNNTCQYSKDQCTVQTTGTCYKGLQDPLGAGKIQGCNNVAVGFENIGHSPCCLKRPPLFGQRERAPVYAGMTNPLPPNQFENMSYATFNNTKHNVFPYSKDVVAPVALNVSQSTCAYLHPVASWDKVALKCNVQPAYQQSSVHTCTIPGIGQPSMQAGKSREHYTDDEQKQAQAACAKVGGAFSTTNGCVVSYSLKDLDKDATLVDKHIQDCHRKKGFYNIRNIAYKEYQGGQCINGMIYAPVRRFCELPSSRVDKKGKPFTGLYNVPPFRYNTNYSGKAFDFRMKKANDLWTKDDWLCASTKSYCDKFEMSYNSDATASKNPGCYEPTGENIAEDIFGKTMVRNFKRDVIENTEDAYQNCGGGVAGVACGTGAAVAGTGEFIRDTVNDVGKSVGKIGEDIGNFFGHVFGG